ncbi:MAG TPA: MFS transporter [Vicinamibacterales bacterium]|nr:MFS transporter [Vicinamibacterales bacterium]
MKFRPFGLHPTVLVLAGTHFIVDGFGNVLSPLLPLLILNLNLSLAAAGTLQMFFQLANSVAQLGFGYIADRWRPRWLLLAGPVVCVTTITLIGLAPDVSTVAFVLVLGGLGGAAFHPPAAALVHRFSGNQRGMAMSTHITSGTVGQAMAPLVFAPFVQQFGLRATPLLMIPALVVLLFVLLRRIPRFDRLQEHQKAGGLSALRPYAKPLALLYLIVVMRTLTAMSFSTFLPVLLTRRGQSLAQAGTVVSIYLVAVGLGGFIGGPSADRFGPRRVIILSLVCSVPFLMIAPLLHGAMFVVVVSMGGFLLQSTLPVNVTFAQLIAPISAATVSSLMMGFAWGMGGLTVPLVGMLADRIGIEHALVAMSALPLIAALLAIPLPSQKQPHVVARASDATTAEGIGIDVAD